MDTSYKLAPVVETFEVIKTYDIKEIQYETPRELTPGSKVYDYKKFKEFETLVNSCKTGLE